MLEDFVAIPMLQVRAITLDDNIFLHDFASYQNVMAGRLMRRGSDELLSFEDWKDGLVEIIQVPLNEYVWYCNLVPPAQLAIGTIKAQEHNIDDCRRELNEHATNVIGVR